MKKYLPIFIFVIVILAVSAAGVFAQSPSRSITVIPPTREVTINPGDKTEGVFKVVNDGDKPLTFNAVIRDYIVKDNQGTPEILPPNTLSNKYSGASWIAVLPSTFTVPPHTRQELNYYIQVPLDARPGGHYAAVMYEPAEILGVEGTGAGVDTQIGTLFYIGVNGDINEDAQVIKFNTTKSFLENGPVTLETEIKNNGDLHIKPKGTITVKNMIGKTISTQPLEDHNIFPEKSFLFTNEFGGKWMIGRYTVNLAATYGQNNNLPLVAATSFIVFPWKVASVAILVIVIIILAFIFLKRQKDKKEQPQE